MKLRQEKWAREQSGEEAKAAFSVFDTDGDGFIPADELRRVLTTMGEVMNDSEVNELIKDAGGGNSINFNEFVDKMKRRT